MRYPLVIFFFTSFIIFTPASMAQFVTGFTFSRQSGNSNSSSSSTAVLSTSRVLDNSCKKVIRSLYSKNNIKNPQNQGCITSPKNVLALPSREGKLDEYKILDNSLSFGVSTSNSSKVIDQTKSQKAVSSFSGFGYSVFTTPQ